MWEEGPGVGDTGRWEAALGRVKNRAVWLVHEPVWAHRGWDRAGATVAGPALGSSPAQPHAFGGAGSRGWGDGRTLSSKLAEQPSSSEEGAFTVRNNRRHSEGILSGS